MSVTFRDIPGVREGWTATPESRMFIDRSRQAIYNGPGDDFVKSAKIQAFDWQHSLQPGSYEKIKSGVTYESDNNDSTQTSYSNESSSTSSFELKVCIWFFVFLCTVAWVIPFIDNFFLNHHIPISISNTFTFLFKVIGKIIVFLFY